MLIMGMEKKGINFIKFYGCGYLDNIIEYNLGYFYIYFGVGVEYN